MKVGGCARTDPAQSSSTIIAVLLFLVITRDDRILSIGVTGNVAEFNPEFGFFNPDGFYAWEVLAIDSEGEGIGVTDRPHVFRIVRDPD